MGLEHSTRTHRTPGLSWRDVLALGHMDDASAALLSGRLMVQSPLQVAGLGTPKQLELLATVVPNLSRVCVLMNPGNFNHAPMLKAAQISADTLGIVALPAEARNLQELDAALVEMTKQRAGAMMVIANSFFVLRRQRIAELALRARLPTMFPNRDSVEAGGLMSYGNSLAEFFRQAATYVDRILKGAKPAELPVEQPTKFLLVVNLKTAKALGLEVPPTLLARTDEVIE